MAGEEVPKPDQTGVEPGEETSTDESTCSDGDYAVGYGKPPKHTRFQPGQSGNPRGRSKGTKNLKTDLTEELGEMIPIREGDRSRRVSKQRALVKTLVTRTLKGDARAASHVITLMMRLMDTGEDTPAIDDGLDENELEILRAFENQVRQTVDRESPVSPVTPDDKEEKSS